MDYNTALITQLALAEDVSSETAREVNRKGVTQCLSPGIKLGS